LPRHATILMLLFATIIAGGYDTLIRPRHASHTLIALRFSPLLMLSRLIRHFLLLMLAALPLDAIITPLRRRHAITLLPLDAVLLLSILAFAQLISPFYAMPLRAYFR